jgi:hypothetical protein
MRSFLLGLIFGAIVMSVAGGIALELLKEPPPPERTPAPQGVALVESGRAAASEPADVAHRLEGAPDAVLAQTLDAAEFDRDWGRVNGVGRTLRARAVVKVDPLTGLAESSGSSGSRATTKPLLALQAEVARRAFILDLRSHDNAAVRLLDRAGEEDAQAKLCDLFLAEAKGPDYEPLRTDAAIVLALGGSDHAREVLGRALKEGGDRGTLAARALGLSDDDRAVALLADLLAHDLDPEVRKRAVAGLARSSAVARGSADAVNALVHAGREDSDESVRAKSLAVLGQVDLARVDAARSLLAAVIHEPSESPAVRTAAIQAVKAHRALARATPSDLVDLLLKTVASEHDGPVRVALADALVEIAPASAVPVLESVLRASQDGQVRDAVARALAAAKERGEPPP